MLDLQAFGPPSLPGTPGLTQPKRLALLVYLALARPRGLQRRDTLLALFWPESTQARGRKALSQALSFLRGILPETVILTRGTEEVGVDFHRIRCDVHRFEEAVREGEWQKALEVYRGDLLAGFHVPRAPGFEDWVLAERERLCEMAAESAWSESLRRLGRGNAGRAQRIARRAISLAPTQEGPVRTFLRALAEAEGRETALHFYERYRLELARALEIEPTRETAALAAALRQGQKEPSGFGSTGPREAGPGGMAANRGRRTVDANEEARALFRKGMHAFESGLPEDYERSLSRLEAALRLEPDFARAHAGMALLLAALPTLTHRVPPAYAERLEEEANRALELAPDSGHAWAARGYYLWTLERDWIGAEEALGQALELEPDDAHVLLLAAEYYRMLGRLEEAIGCLNRAEDVTQDASYPQVLRAGVEISLAEHGELDPEVPIRRLQAIIHREPSDGLAHLWRAIALSQTHGLEEILTSVETSLRINPEIPLAHGFRGAVLARWGRKKSAQAEEAWFRAEESSAPRDRFSWGLLRLALGDLDGGFRLMEEGVRKKPSFLLPGFRLMRSFERFWKDPRFEQVMDALWPEDQRSVLGPYGWQPDECPSSAMEG